MSAPAGQIGASPTPSTDVRESEEPETSQALSDMDEGDDDEGEYMHDLDEFLDEEMNSDSDYEDTDENDETPAWDDGSPDIDLEDSDDESEGGGGTFSIPSALLEAIAGRGVSGGVPHLVVSRDTIMRALNIAGPRTGISRASAIRGIDRFRERPPPREAVPSQQGLELMRSGQFGADDSRTAHIKQSKKLARRVFDREMGSFSYGREKTNLASWKHDLIPTSKADTIIQYPARCYSGQFSDDGNFFFSCCQDMRVRMYDTSNPYKWRYYKSLKMEDGSWTITDGTLSKDNKWIAYCSLTPQVCLASTDPLDQSHPRLLDFAKVSGRSQGRHGLYFSIYSVRFSGDGRELVAGTGGRHSTENSIFVFDIERNESILRLPGHDDDINAVCYGDKNSPHILYSGSDDSTIKVWDRRSLADGRPSAVFLGHSHGLTFVDSKGDGRYVLSNSKDHSAKLWDLRKAFGPEEADETSYWRSDRKDCSVVTFRGHSVENTLIRCHFSPQGSTDGRYVYSGSKDGQVYIWNLDATIKARIDVNSSSMYLKTYDDNTDDYWGSLGSGFNTVIRDCAWHPDVPMIAATAWNGWGGGLGTCSIHTWKEGIDEEEPKTHIVGPQLQPIDENPHAPRRRNARW